MKKYFYIVLIAPMFALAQVGINTTTPAAQLDIKSSNQATPANTDGILIPKIDAFPAVNPTAAQKGMLVYLTTASGANQPGFYFWNNPGWVRIVSGSAGGTLDQSYDFGGAGAGRTITADTGAVTIAGTDGLVSTGVGGSGVLAPSGAGVRMVWNPLKYAFRAGVVTGNEWDDTNIGNGSVAFGAITTAVGDYSAAFGFGPIASGAQSVAFGTYTTASASSSAAFGESTFATGLRSAAFGYLTNASGENATVFGQRQSAPSYGETVFGIGATFYSITSNGATQFRTTNATDRLFVVGNAIDANNNNIVDATERSDALVILKNGNTGIGSSSPQDKLHVVGNIRMVDGNQGAGKVLTSDANGTATWQNASTNAWGLTGNVGTNPATNFMGTSDDQDLVLKTNSIDNLRIKNDGRIEMGTKGFNPNYLNASTISKKLYIASETSTNNVVFQASNNLGDPVSMYFGSSGGTLATPTISATNENISNIFFSGYDGAKFITSSSIRAGIDGTPGLNSMPGKLEFLTTPNSSDVPATRMTIRSTGNVGIGTTTPADRLHVIGNIRMVDGNQAAGKVLTSDANGTATWQDASANAWGLTGNAGTTPGTNFIGTTDASDVVFKRDNSESMRIRSFGSFGGIQIADVSNINASYEGTMVPKLLVASDSSTSDNLIVLASHDTANGRATLNLARKKGALGIFNTQVADGDGLGEVVFSGASSFSNSCQNAALIFADVDGSLAAGSVPAKLGFSTAPATGGAPLERMTIRANGNVGIGTNNPLDRLHVAGNIRMVDGNQAAGKVLTSDANGTATWQNASANAWGLTGNTGTSAATNFLGTTDDVDVIFRRFNTRAGRIGTNNTSLGVNALNTAVTGGSNTAIGVDALKSVTTGTNNTSIGQNALGNINGGSFNTAIGAEATTSSTILTNATAIGSRAVAGNSNVLVLGSISGVNGATSSVNVGMGTTTPQTKLHIVDANKVTSNTGEGNLHVVTNDAQNTDIGGSISLGGFGSSTTTASVFGTIEGRKSNAGALSDSGYLIFKTNNVSTLTERMRITNTGNVGIGTTTPGGQFELSLDQGRKPTTNTWTVPSDARLKEVHGAYEKGLAEILQLRPIRYHYINTSKKTFDQKVLDTEACGFLAQEVQPLFPEAVGNDEDGYLNFNIHPILIASVNALKELNAKNNQLESENQALKASIQELNNKVLIIMADIEQLKK